VLSYLPRRTESNEPRQGELFETSPPSASIVLSPSVPDISLTVPYIRNTTFSWNKPGVVSGSETPTSGRKRNFQLVINGELKFKEGELNLICGPTGCGKTSLLMALLGEIRSSLYNVLAHNDSIAGEMYNLPQEPDAVCLLPREGGVAYAAQESWVLNDTIKVQNLSSCNRGFILMNVA
jgi:hypothetical protein